MPLAVSAVSIAWRVVSISSLKVTNRTASVLKSSTMVASLLPLAGLVHFFDQTGDDALLQLLFASAGLAPRSHAITARSISVIEG